ncbi:putative uncharacterized protein DDB_G0274435 [Eupeodes corollae]|uniref:putative uncharacterized protein DDB_G0274435 n=1 Tax=Eupeodes corollae TaxID=290404 RepID=UPI0024920FE1|nr:putative uncharacterized protein DDB_G0274435 [Eupeodes corollae]
MEKEKRAGVSKDTSANISGDVVMVPAAVPKTTATTSGQASDQSTSRIQKRKLKKQSPNKVKRTNSAKRQANKKKMEGSGKGDFTTESDFSDYAESEKTEYISEGGEGHYRSPNNRYSILSEPEPVPSTKKVLEGEGDLQEETELVEALQAKQAAISQFEQNLKKLKEEMEPLLRQLKLKQEARRQEEAQQQPQNKPASKISGAEHFKKTPPATAGPSVEGPTTSTKAKQRLQEESKQPQQQPILQQQQQQQQSVKYQNGPDKKQFQFTTHPEGVTQSLNR